MPAGPAGAAGRPPGQDRPVTPHEREQGTRTRPDPLGDVRIGQVRSRTSLKWRFHPPDVLPLWVAEMDVLLAAPVAAALHDAVTRGDTGYAHGDDLARAFAGFARRRWGWEVDVARTALVPDVMTGVVEALRLVSGPGAAVVVNTPVYPPFRAFAERSGHRVVDVPLTAAGRLDLPALEAAYARERARGEVVHLLCNPQNPTGTVHTAAELTALAELAAARGVRVVADEVHAPLADPAAGFAPYLAHDPTGLGTALTSASKGWNLAGVPAALLLAGPAAAGDLARLPEEAGHGVAHLGVLAHAAAFRAGGEWLDGLLDGLARRRALLDALLAEHLPAVRRAPSRATYLAWLDCRDLGLGDDPARVLLERGRVALSAGHEFGPAGRGFARLNLATGEDVLTEAVRRMAAALDG